MTKARSNIWERIRENLKNECYIRISYSGSIDKPRRHRTSDSKQIQLPAFVTLHVNLHLPLVTRANIFPKFSQLFTLTKYGPFFFFVLYTSFTSFWAPTQTSIWENFPTRNWSCLLSLRFSPEDRGSIYLWNVNTLLTDYKESHSKTVLFMEQEIFCIGIRISQHFTETEGSLRCSQEPPLVPIISQISAETAAMA
jgi:hypothetical protein